MLFISSFDPLSAFVQVHQDMPAEGPRRALPPHPLTNLCPDRLASSAVDVNVPRAITALPEVALFLCPISFSTPLAPHYNSQPSYFELEAIRID